jgi:hypothetical protein
MNKDDNNKYRFDCLPDDLLTCIFGLAGQQATMNLALTSKTMLGVVRRPNVWKCLTLNLSPTTVHGAEKFCTTIQCDVQTMILKSESPVHIIAFLSALHKGCVPSEHTKGVRRLSVRITAPTTCVHGDFVFWIVHVFPWVKELTILFFAGTSKECELAFPWVMPVMPALEVLSISGGQVLKTTFGGAMHMMPHLHTVRLDVMDSDVIESAPTHAWSCRSLSIKTYGTVTNLFTFSTLYAWQRCKALRYLELHVFADAELVRISRAVRRVPSLEVLQLHIPPTDFFVNVPLPVGEVILTMRMDDVVDDDNVDDDGDEFDEEEENDVEIEFQGFLLASLPVLGRVRIETDASKPPLGWARKRRVCVVGGRDGPGVADEDWENFLESVDVECDLTRMDLFLHSMS